MPTPPRGRKFYAELLGRAFKSTEGAAITEFAWKGALPPPTVMQGGGIYGVTCDPCPPPSPVDDPLAKFLGADVMPGLKTDEDIAKFAQAATITRLHLRYTKDQLADDLVFKAAAPIAGGIPEVMVTAPAKENRFQGRYIVRKPFDVSQCDRYDRQAMGFTPVGSALAGAEGTQSASKKLSEPFESYLRSDVAELGLKAKPEPKKPTPKAK